MTDTTASGDWAPPGPGRWELDAEHMPGPPSGVLAELAIPALVEGTRQGFARYGLPLDTLDVRLLRGHLYARMKSVGEGKNPEATPPPPAVLKLLVRLHPGLRRRARRAKRAVADRLWREDADRWRTEVRPAWVQRLVSLQDEDPAALTDGELAEHVERTAAAFADGARVHFDLTVATLGVGDLVVALEPHGVSASEALDLLRGSSPASVEAEAAASDPDEYFRVHQWWIVGGFDVDNLALCEVDADVRSAIEAGRDRSGPGPAVDDGAVLDRVPPHLRSDVEQRLADARAVYGLQDDHAGITWHWPLGLLRRALREAGTRLAERARVADPADLFEATPAETAALLRADGGPTATDLAARAERRREAATLDAPRAIGQEPDPPPMDVFPAAMARVSRAMLAVAELWVADGVSGTGIGTEPVRGRAVVTTATGEAYDRFEPGDILVAPFTSPADDPILFQASGLVVESGGPLSHSAVMARELQIPAVLGAAGACSSISDGDEIELDPVAGTVRVVAQAVRAAR